MFVDHPKLVQYLQSLALLLETIAVVTHIVVKIDPKAAVYSSFFTRWAVTVVLDPKVKISGGCVSGRLEIQIVVRVCLQS